jgi:hypothetical protein
VNGYDAKTTKANLLLIQEKIGLQCLTPSPPTLPWLLAAMRATMASIAQCLLLLYHATSPNVNALWARVIQFQPGGELALIERCSKEDLSIMLVPCI